MAVVSFLVFSCLQSSRLLEEENPLLNNEDLPSIIKSAMSILDEVERNG